MKPKITFTYCLFVASLICLLAVAQSNQPNATGKKQWPNQRQSTSEHDAAVSAAVDAFTATLTKAGHNTEFRKNLTASCGSAKKTVSDEGNIDIPDDVVIMFYEPGTYGDHFGLLLPPLNEQAHTPYKYTDDDFYECCYPSFSKLLVTTRDPALAAALDAAMTHAGYEQAFRDKLTASCESAKKAVEDEGHIQIRTGVEMMFQANKGDERYHIFELPPFAASGHKDHKYADQFRGLYPVWPNKPPTPAPVRTK